MQAHIFYVLYSVEDCKKLAAHAEAHGADGIACMAPVFFKPGTVEALVDFLAQVCHPSYFNLFQRAFQFIGCERGTEDTLFVLLLSEDYRGELQVV